MSQASQPGGQKHGACLRRCVTKRRAYEFPGGSTLDMFWLCRCLVICFCLKRMDCGQRPDSPYVLKENVNIWYDFKVWGWSVQTESCPQGFKVVAKKRNMQFCKIQANKHVANPPKKESGPLQIFQIMGWPHRATSCCYKYYIINTKIIGKRNRLNKCQDNDSPGQLNQMMQQVKNGIHTKKATKYGNEANMAQICVVWRLVFWPARFTPFHISKLLLTLMFQFVLYNFRQLT